MRLILLSGLLLLVACAGQPPERHEYLLRPPASASFPAGRVPLRLLPVQLAPYLDQEGIVVQVSDVEVRPAKLNRWAEPLDEAVGRYLQVAIANAAGRPVEVSPLLTGEAGVEVQVRISQLHGSANGDVRLVAEWWARNAEGVGRLAGFDRTVRQSGKGYTPLVEAHAALLDELADAIAGSLD